MATKFTFLSMLLMFFLLGCNNDKKEPETPAVQNVCGKDGYQCSCNVFDPAGVKFFCQDCISGFCETSCGQVITTLRNPPYSIPSLQVPEGEDASEFGSAEFTKGQGCDKETAKAKCEDSGAHFTATPDMPIVEFDLYYYYSDKVPKGAKKSGTAHPGFGTQGECEGAITIPVLDSSTTTVPGTYTDQSASP